VVGLVTDESKARYPHPDGL